MIRGGVAGELSLSFPLSLCDIRNVCSFWCVCVFDEQAKFTWLSARVTFVHFVTLNVVDNSKVLWAFVTKGALWMKSLSLIEDEHRLIIVNCWCLCTDPHLHFPSDYPAGCLLGCVDLVDCLSQEDYRQKVGSLAVLVFPRALLTEGGSSHLACFPLSTADRGWVVSPCLFFLEHCRQRVGSLAFLSLEHCRQRVGSLTFLSLEHCRQRVGSLTFLSLEHCRQRVGSPTLLVSLEHCWQRVGSLALLVFPWALPTEGG